MIKGLWSGPFFSVNVLVWRNNEAILRSLAKITYKLL